MLIDIFIISELICAGRGGASRTFFLGDCDIEIFIRFLVLNWIFAEVLSKGGLSYWVGRPGRRQHAIQNCLNFL